MSLRYVWGAAEKGAREHLFQVPVDVSWTPPRPPRSGCGNVRASEMKPTPAPGLPRCRNCQHIADMAEDRAIDRARAALASRYREAFAELLEAEKREEGLL